MQSSPTFGPTPAETGPQIAPESRHEPITEVFFQVGTETTTISGRTQLLKDYLPKLGARWDSKARLWTLPASRTDELVSLCQAKNVKALEVRPDEAAEGVTETLWPKGEEAARG